MQKRTELETKMCEDERQRQLERERLEVELENAKRVCLIIRIKFIRPILAGNYNLQAMNFNRDANVDRFQHTL